MAVACLSLFCKLPAMPTEIPVGIRLIKNSKLFADGEVFNKNLDAGS